MISVFHSSFNIIWSSQSNDECLNQSYAIIDLVVRSLLTKHPPIKGENKRHSKSKIKHFVNLYWFWSIGETNKQKIHHNPVEQNLIPLKLFQFHRYFIPLVMLVVQVFVKKLKFSKIHDRVNWYTRYACLALPHI